MSSSDRPVAEGDQIAFEDHVDRAAGMVADGVADLDDIHTEPYHDETDAELRQAVRATLAEAGDGGQDDPDNVDWAALWDEFGFDGPDGAGEAHISKTQLDLALEVTDQAVQGNPVDHISEAVDDEVLLVWEDSGGSLRGYSLAGDLQ